MSKSEQNKARWREEAIDRAGSYLTHECGVCRDSADAKIIDDSEYPKVSVYLCVECVRYLARLVERGTAEK